jgi:hypothetical protein
MRTTGRVCSLFLMGIACFGQNAAALFQKAPPDVEEALRARIQKFYGLYMEGKFRAADALVAEDSKDAFYVAGKRKCRSVDIDKLQFSENFSKADVMVTCDTDVMIEPVGLIRTPVPMRTRWKMLDGDWFWYIDPASDQGMATPFGFFKAGSPSGSPAGTGMPAAAMSVEALAQLVKVDRQQVSFDVNTKGVGRVVIANAMPGAVSLVLEPKEVPGFEIALDKTSIAQGQTAVLSIGYVPSKERKPLQALVKIVVSPTEQEIPIRIGFTGSSAQ